MEIGRSRMGGRRWWCGFNASILAREGRRWDEALSKDEEEVASSSWLHGKEAQYGAAAWPRWSKERRHRGEEREETMQLG
jgi:hypothetical protein